MAERWLPVVGYEDFYEVSDQGRVRRRQTKRPLSSFLDNTGYTIVNLSRPGQRGKQAKIRRLVLLAFVGPPPTLRHIGYHKNDDRADAHLKNLEWAKRPNNLQHRRPQRPVLQRIFDRVQITDGCWLWQGYTFVGDYGGIRFEGRCCCVHRVVWELITGCDPTGYDLHHRCEEPRCVNPDHLQPMEPSAHGRHHKPGCEGRAPN